MQCRRCLSPFGVLLLIALGLAGPASAQKITGDITGTIVDTSGGALPGAVVTVQCEATAATRTVVTGPDGGYRISDLPVCVYKVVVTNAGFKTTTRSVQVAVSALTKADFRLEIGDKSEAVIVEGIAPTVEFSDKLNNYVDKARIDNLPLSGRDFNSLLGVTPGVQRQPGGGFLAVTISGQRSTSNNYMVDGISNNDPYYGDSVLNQTGVLGIPATLVPMDAIAEFTVQQTPGTEFGGKGGAAINVVMKSGTNQLHGSGYFFLHDDFADAANYFAKASGGGKTPLSNKQFGATLGGPIIKDKTFFFGYYEGQRLDNESPYQTNVPMPAQVAEARARIRAAGLTTNPVGEALLKYYPVDPGGTLGVSTPNTAEMNTWSLKLDHHLNHNNVIAFRGFHGKSFQSAPALTGGNLELTPAGDNPADMFNSVAPTRVWLVGGTWTSVLDARTVLETRVGYSRFSQTIGVNNTVDPKSLGMDTGPLDVEDFGVPAVYYASSFGYIGGIAGYPITTAPNATADLSTSLSRTTGAHTLKVGGNVQRATTYSLRNRARTSFDVNQNGDPVDALVGLLLGRFAGASRSFGSTKRNLRRDSVGLFVSDDWKLSPRVTLSVGLRYDWSGPIGERDNIGSNFFPERGLVDLGPGLDQLYETQKTNFGPRLGVSWDVFGNGKTALRGGYALTYDVPNFGTIHAPQVGFLGARSGAYTQINQGIFSVSLNGDMGVAPESASATCVDPTTGAGNYVCVQPGVPIFGANPGGAPPYNAVSVVSPLKSPQFHLFHATVQHEVFRKNVLTLSYVGQRGTNLIANRDLNAPPLGSDFNDPQPHRPYAAQFPDLKHIVQITNDSKSWYNSLQASWRQQNWKGINTQYNLTWSKCLDYSSANRLGGARSAFPQYSNPYDMSKNKGPCDYDVPLNLNVGGTFDVPHIGLGRLGSGWQIGTVLTSLSGRPFTPNLGSRDRSGQDIFALRASCAPGASVLYNPRDPNHYIANPEMFSEPANGTVGDCGRNILRGPGLSQWDLSLIKMTKVNARMKVQLRWEVFNILNHANFGTGGFVTNVRSDTFGSLSSTPDVDSGNPVIAQGGPRSMQFVLKLLF